VSWVTGLFDEEASRTSEKAMIHHKAQASARCFPIPKHSVPATTCESGICEIVRSRMEWEAMSAFEIPPSMAVRHTA